ncbi:hypothetical protein ACJIZ3_000750 [Penstemon smallii]|uniref:Translation initiation factor IF-3 n=1 Tax=Penstemon smallii TaxID=265156 RepID=A0ABD3U1S6_9LAMI
MAFLCRMKQGRHKFHLFSNEFKRCYISNQVINVANQHVSSRTLIPVPNNPTSDVHSSQLGFFCNVRFYAAPVQFTQKKEEKDTSGPRMNEQITTQFIRLVTDEGHTVISKHDALARAKSLKMDLVEVDRRVKPPACKIYDYKREKYLTKVREKQHKERLKSKGVKPGAFKEVKFAAKIKQQDLQVKANMVKRLIESGHRVKCTAVEPTNDVDLQTLLSRFSALIEDIALVESAPRVEKKQAFVIVRHIKFGPSKKGSAKKISEVISSATLSQSSETQELKGKGDTMLAETDHKIHSEELSDEDVQNISTAFDIEDEVKKAPSTPMAVQNRYARDTKEHSTRNNRVNSAPQIPNQGKQPQFSMNSSPQMRPPPRRFEVPGNEIPRQDSSPTKGFGIFNAQTPSGQNATVDTNRYKKNNPSINRGPGVNNQGQGRWGAFGTDNTNVIPNKRNEGQTDYQRR